MSGVNVSLRPTLRKGGSDAYSGDVNVVWMGRLVC